MKSRFLCILQHCSFEYFPILYLRKLEYGIKIFYPKSMINSGKAMDIVINIITKKMMETTSQFLTPFISRTAILYLRTLVSWGTNPHASPPNKAISNISWFLQITNNTTSITIPEMITYFLFLPSTKMHKESQIRAAIIPVNKIMSFFP